MAIFNASDVLKEERELIGVDGARPYGPDSLGKDPLIGLALSGGGMRAATFHLGVLQAFSEVDIIKRIDYLSSVSGGSYIAGWLAKYLSERPNGVSALAAMLSRRPFDKESAEIHRLRQHSSFLTPKLGVFGKDTWLFIATYIHNLLANQLVIATVFALLVFTPRIILLGLKSILEHPTLIRYAAIGGCAFACLAAAGVFWEFYMRYRPKGTFRTSWVVVPVGLISFLWSVWGVMYFQELILGCAIGTTVATVMQIFTETEPSDKALRTRFLYPAMSSALLISLVFFFEAATSPPAVLVTSFDRLLALWNSERFTSIPLRWLTVGISLAIFCTCCMLVQQNVMNQMAKLNQRVRTVFGLTILAGMTAAFTYYMGYRSESIVRFLASRIRAVAIPHAFIETFAFAVPAFIAIGNAVVNLLVALLGRIVPHDARERLSSLSGRLYRYCVVWVAIAAVTFYGPLLVYAGTGTWRLALFAGWLGAALIGFVSERRLRRISWLPDGTRLLIEHGAPYAFLGGMAIGVSFLVTRFVLNIQSSASYWKDVYETLHPVDIVALAILAVLATMLSMRLGINLSSMHVFYQARLAQAFLGEALPGRGTQSHLHNLICRTGEDVFCRPYPLFNASINLGDASEPAWQERQAANFVFSPLYCGYTLGGDALGGAFQHTAAYSYSGQKGIRLAQAMTISGAAIGAGMGYQTSARGRFVHSLLNLRLGWWFSNPANPLSWTSDIPRSRLSLWLKEISAKTSERGPFVYLSDGGHFENLGVYELIRRKCSVVIASDASEDPDGHCSALGRALERCRTDFGVAIDIRTPQTIEGADHFTIGTIDYGPNIPSGVIVYLKPMITGNEPSDIKSYRFLQPAFPHHHTRDQWFRESEFESYRALGEHVGKEFINRVLNQSLGENSEEIDTLRGLLPISPNAGI